ncbi:hypothetical protein [Vibrio lentus]|uniref:hypothetical protein n=1 Tax=Vibrio lentus TaxID=136468 RepID=UPI00097663A4|nr:hypothetical protein [Vibrio lentus]OMO22310.1 hypothetical protein BH583_09030 [Vibrio lentus]
MNYEQIKAMSSAINPTMSQQELMYVVQRSAGQSPRQAGDAVGVASESAVLLLERRPDIVAMLDSVAEAKTANTAIVQAQPDKFTRGDAQALYNNAYAMAVNATEMIKAVDSMVKLHGLAAPEKQEVTVTNHHQVTQASEAELLELIGGAVGGREIILNPEDYKRTS